MSSNQKALVRDLKHGYAVRATDGDLRGRAAQYRSGYMRSWQAVLTRVRADGYRVGSVGECDIDPTSASRRLLTIAQRPPLPSILDTAV